MQERDGQIALHRRISHKDGNDKSSIRPRNQPTSRSSSREAPHRTRWPKRLLPLGGQPPYASPFASGADWKSSGSWWRLPSAAVVRPGTLAKFRSRLIGRLFHVQSCGAIDPFSWLGTDTFRAIQVEGLQRPEICDSFHRAPRCEWRLRPGLVYSMVTEMRSPRCLRSAAL
jgi:hypothetical protein